MASTDAEIADAIRTALARRALAGATGSVTVTFDGVTSTYDEAGARSALEYWERRAAKAAGTSRMVRTLGLRSAW